MAGNVPPAAFRKSHVAYIEEKSTALQSVGVPPSAFRKSHSHLPYIEKMSTALQSVGVPACVFQPETYLQYGCTEALFAKLLRPLQNYNDAAKLERVLQIGTHHHHFDTYRSASGDQFYDFLGFLRTPAGQNALSLVAQQDRLARRGGDHFTAQEMGWIAMFEAQSNDLSVRLGDVRRDHEAAINDLEHQLCEARYQLETGLTPIKGKLLPAGLYTPLCDVDFNKACWTEYLLECRRQKQQPVGISLASFDNAVLNFGDQVKQQHIVDFLYVGNRKQQLQDYIDRRSTD